MNQSGRGIFISALLVLLTACTAVGSDFRPPAYYQEDSQGDSKPLVGQSLFGDNDQKIAAMLDHRVALPQLNRVAILKISPDNYWRHYSDNFNQLSDSLVSSLVMPLRASARVYDASFLPAMLIPTEYNLPILREAAARFQADTLLIYSSQCQTYRRFRFFDENKSRAYCQVEAVLLDVRSGIIVQSIASLEDYDRPPASDQYNTRERDKQAELEALAKALGEVARQVVGFFEQVPVLGASQ